MSVTKLVIANRALDQVKSGPIASFADTSKEARKCNELIDPAINLVLGKIKGGFNERSVALALVSGVDPSTVSKYTYAYIYPADCLIADKIYNDATENEEIDFKLQTNAAKDAIHIYTNKEDAVLIYSALTSNFSVIRSERVIKAIVYELASQLVMPLLGDRELKKDLINEAFGYLAQAKEGDGNERHDNVDYSSHYIDAEL
jgi:hypothetical protein